MMFHERPFDTPRLPSASDERLASHRVIFLLSAAHYACGSLAGIVATATHWLPGLIR